MDVKCVRCDSVIPTENMNINALVAKCNICNAVFSLNGLAGEAKPRRATVPMPDSIAVEDTGREMTITRRWRSLAAYFLVLFCVIWNAFMVVWFSMAIKSGIWIMVAAGSIHGLVGLGLIYYTIAMFINRTIITVNRDTLSVHHAPLPWFGNVKLAAGKVDQIWCRMRIQYRNNGGSTTTYEVHANSTHGQSKTLLKGLNNADEALFLEQQIETYLKLEDKPVPGAYVGD